MAKTVTPPPPTGSVRQVNIGQEMREAYLDYAMSVIVARALPDARDGLKPVHRRILYAMYDMGLRSDTPFRKSARIVGEVLGKYHPHGDAAVYEALVRMAQDFSMRYPLVNGQGNFGSIDGDGAAAMRYTEARMTALGEDLLDDIDMETVGFTDNFDGSLQEPVVLPSAIPNLLVSGASGIAVGMSTNIPPHNLGEVSDALQHMLRHWETLDEVTVHDLMRYVQGPDFPTGGLIYHHDETAGDTDDEGSLVSAYATGRGKIIMRAKLHIEDMGRGKSRIIITEIPYQTNKTTLIERIAMLVRDGRLEGISDLRDESDRQGLRMAIELQRGADAEEVLRQLFRLTPLQETYSIIMLALVNGEPRILSLKQALRVFLDHRIEVVRRRSEYQKRRAQERAHILGGLLKALDVLDVVIETIRKAQSADDARLALMKLLGIDDVQARAILDMQLRRIAALERMNIQSEYDEKMALIAYLEGLLTDDARLRSVISDELAAVKRAYNDPRRTVIVDGKASNISAMTLPEEATWVTLSIDGRLGRSFESTLPRINTDTKTPPRLAAESSTSHTLYLLTAGGMGASVPVHQIPQVHAAADGTPPRDVSALGQADEVAAMLSIGPNTGEGYLFLATVHGEVKRIRLDDLPGLMANQFKVIDIEPGDRLLTAFVTTGDDEVILTTAQAQAIRFREADVRATTMGTGGMRGIKLTAEPLLNTNDHVIGAGVVHKGDVLWTIADNGIAKQSPIDEFPTQGRAGAGVIAMKLPPDSAGLAAAVCGAADEQVVIITSKGKPKQVRLGAAVSARRAGKGESVIALFAKEQVMTVMMFQRAQAALPEAARASAVET